MSHTQRNTLYSAAVILMTILAAPIHAADTIDIPWNQLCAVARGRELQFTTVSGETVDGYCLRLDVDEVSIRSTGSQLTKVAREAISQLRVKRSQDHQLRALGKGMAKSFRGGIDALFSPMAPAGLIAIPGTVAWGAVSAPFCLLGDLKSKLSGRQEIRVH